MNDTEQVPAEVWEQEISGGSVGGHLPRVAQAVVVAGVVQTREAPPLTAIAIRVPNVSLGFVGHLVGASPQRRRLLVSTSVDVVLGTDKGSVQAGNGLLVKSGVGYPPILAAEDIWFLVTGAGPGDVTAWAEVDPG